MSEHRILVQKSESIDNDVVSEDLMVRTITEHIDLQVLACDGITPCDEIGPDFARLHRCPKCKAEFVIEQEYKPLREGAYMPNRDLATAR